MAYAERDPRTGIYYVGFRLNGRKFKRSIDTKSAKEAESVRARVDETIRLLKLGRVALPPGADLVTFVISDGRLQKPLEAPVVLTLGELFKRFRENPLTAHKEQETIYHEVLRTKHYESIIGKKTLVSELSTSKLQEYVIARSRQTNREGKPISQVTVRNEVQCLMSIVNRWALPLGLVPQRLSARGLVYPKTRAMIPFQTFDQIEKQIARGVSPEEERELWDSLYLTSSEIDELLNRTKEKGPLWMHTLIAIACHTGARRGEMLRMQMQDLDIDAGLLQVREKKKDRSRDYTIRHVPLSGYLKGELAAWLTTHPGGRWLVCTKRDAPTTIGELRYHFEVATKGTKFQRLGSSIHCFRHSFISLAVAKGVDQRLIDQMVGHSTEDMRRRYTHIAPATSREALDRIFS